MGVATSCLCNEQSDAVEQTQTNRSMPPREEDDVLASLPPFRHDECVCEDSVFYDARQSLTQSMMDVYHPAALPSFIPRGSVMMEQPETLLQSDVSKKRRDSIIVLEKLEEPLVKIDQRGYPGNLTPDELEKALDFRRALKEDEAKREIVHVFIPMGIEDEPHALCRVLRARNFDAEATLEMLGQAVPNWLRFKKHDFYPNIQDAVCCPGSVLLQQYPFVFCGNAKNGCVLNYQMIGRMSVQGLECVTNPNLLPNYVMHSIMFEFTKVVQAAQEQDSDRMARCECIAVIDLKGLDKSQLNKTTIGILKQISTATGCFPELLNKMLVLNAPYAFSFFWTLIKAFADAKTVAKIEIYTNEAKGKQRLGELVEKDELLSDYGGTRQSFDELARSKGCNEGVSRLASKLMTFNSTECSVVKLSKGEKASIFVYTRHEGAITLSRGKDLTAEVELKRPQDHDSELPFCTTVGTNPIGPGKITVSASPGTTSSSSDYLFVYVEVSQC